MPKFTFEPQALRHGLTCAKLVKPVTNDFTLKLIGKRLTIFSSDRRRSARAEVPSTECDVDDSYESPEHFLPADRQTFLDSELAKVSLSVTDKGLAVKTTSANESQSRSATIKRRAELSRRSPLPKRPTLVAGARLKAKEFEELLRQVSCSAMVRETKTEEDMRVNQVHFYPEASCAVSNARLYATVASLPGMNLDLSVISADLPLMKAFCSKLEGDIEIGQDKTHLFIQDPVTESYLIFSRVAIAKPKLGLLPEIGHKTILAIDRDQFSKCLSWCAQAIEGTQRLTLIANARDESGKGDMEFLNGKQEVGRIPIQFTLGKRLQSDFPVKYLAGIVRYLGEGRACLKFDHPDAPFLLEISEEDQDGSIKARHFIQSMPEH